MEATRKIKKGVLNKDEKAFIDKNFRKSSAEEMGMKLNRSPELISKYVLEQGGMDPNSGLLTGLRTRPEWENFQLEFSNEELKVFEYYYIRLMGQFGADDILATEEMQIFSYIRHELQRSRIGRESKKIHTEMEEIIAEQQRLKPLIAAARGAAKRELRDEHDKLDRQYLQLTQSLKDVTGRNDALVGRQNQILKELKGTRDQRVKLVEGSKNSFTATLKLLMEEDYRNRQDEQIRMVKVASAKELDRLSTPYLYEDGVVDQPILTSETLREY